jgi:hypothetical protein
LGRLCVSAGVAKGLADKHKQKQRKATGKGRYGCNLGFFGFAFNLGGLSCVYNLNDCALTSLIKFGYFKLLGK